jgi:DNA-binding response OmpR family regulator
MPRLVLVVDADPALCEILRQALRPAEVEDLTLTSGEQAASHLEGTKFDAILVNLCGSPQAGVELTRRIRGTGPNRTTPIILIGSDQSKGALSLGFNAGASFFICMPMDMERLTKLIVNISAIENKARRFRRVALRLKVQLVSANAQVEGETVDISLGGMLVKVPRTFPKGAFVEVSLYLPSDTKPIVGLGTVTRTGDEEMGIRIDRLTIEASSRLEEHLLEVFVV